mmetsp:Transcript_2074/g.6136  ORF Transcript_2074/g.6136 Transcript_2074/m.6136 type:complete len:285 (+) Transcript_2074:1734-2588(+)
MQLSSLKPAATQPQQLLPQCRSRQLVVPCRAAGTVRERVRPIARPSKQAGEMSLQQWDLERARLERLAGSNSIVKFTRRQQLKERKPDSQPEVKRVRVIEPELIQQAQVVQPVEPEVLSPVASSIAVPATLPQGNTADDWKTVVALSAAIAMICSVDRAAMSVALGPMGDIFSWTDTTKGAISSSFFLGYTLTNLIGVLDVPRPQLLPGPLRGHFCRCFAECMRGTALNATGHFLILAVDVEMLCFRHLERRWVRSDALQSQDSADGWGGAVECVHPSHPQHGG